jgi:hypothetical protein
MYDTAYDILALIMRYFFLVLVFYILLRLIRSSLHEYRTIRKAKRQLANYTLGYMEICEPEELSSAWYELGRETTIGTDKSCDICLDTNGLAPIHATIYEAKGKIFISGLGTGSGVIVNGRKIKRKDVRLQGGDYIQLGSLCFLLHPFGEEDPPRLKESTPSDC